MPDVVYALTYGMGHLLVDHGRIKPGFGLQYAARSLRPAAMRSVSRQSMGQRPQTDLTTIPGGGDARAFDLVELNAVVSRIIGRCPSVDGEGPDVTIRAADGLRLALGRTAPTLIKDLDQVSTRLTEEIDNEDLRLLTRMTPLSRDDRHRSTLDNRLAAALHGHGDDPVALSWPWELVDAFGIVEKAQLFFRNRPLGETDDLTLDHITDVVCRYPNRSALKTIGELKIILTADEDGDEPVSALVPARQWVAFETRIDDQLYFHHNGRWFTLSDDYHHQIRSEADRILSAAPLVSLQRWQKGWDEDKFNKNQGTGFLTLDKKLIATTMHPRGVEHCDILGPRDEFIHVKTLRRSTDASHLFAQALVSGEQLLFDAEARHAFGRKVQSLSGGQRTAPERPKAVVLGIYGRGQLTVDKLFTFSQVTLVRLVHQLERYGLKVGVVSILPG